MKGEKLHQLTKIDRLVHEPARLLILCMLSLVEEADFLFLLRETGLTRGNLSTHLTKLESGGYVLITKTFVGKRPQTVCRLSPEGTVALTAYRQMLKQALEL